MGPSDEVKVYNNEGEDERDEGNSAEKEAELLDEKTSLIKEEEQVQFDIDTHLSSRGLYASGI